MTVVLTSHRQVIFDVEAVRRDFPVLGQRVHGKPLVYLDNAATTQRPTPVVDAIEAYYREYNASVHRGAHALAERSTHAFEQARAKLTRWLRVREGEVVFVRGCTEAINLVAYGYAMPRLKPGDEVLITEMEHHSNIVPWQLVAKRTGATLVSVPILPDGSLDLQAYDRLLTPRTKIVACVHVSNVLGSVNPVWKIADKARRMGAVSVIDGAQAMAHGHVDVAALGCDFYAFSAHKMFGPTGIGALFGRRELLEVMEPFQGGGDMIERVTLEETTYAAPPARFEAGTPNIAGAIGLGAAVDYLAAMDREAAGAYEQALGEYCREQMAEVPGLRLLGGAAARTPSISFRLRGVHPYDLAVFLDHYGVAIRSGHLCAQPLMRRLGVEDSGGAARASLAFYNTRAEVDAFVLALRQAGELLA